MLNNTNTYLQSAKNTKNDEFYTPFEAIEKEKVSLFFIEAKKTPLNTHDLGQILVYSRICNPEKAFLFSSAGTGSLEKSIRLREDLTFYSQDKRLKMIQIAKWDVARNMPDVISMIPKII